MGPGIGDAGHVGAFSEIHFCYMVAECFTIVTIFNILILPLQNINEHMKLTTLSTDSDQWIHSFLRLVK